MWNTIHDITGKRSTVIATNILFPIVEIGYESFEWRTPYPIKIKFIEKDLVVYYIKCFT